MTEELTQKSQNGSSLSRPGEAEETKHFERKLSCSRRYGTALNPRHNWHKKDKNIVMLKMKL